MSALPKRWLREPLLHFLFIGVLLFAAYRMLHPELSRTADVNRIELTEDDLRQLEVAWTAQWRRPPTSEEMHRTGRRPRTRGNPVSRGSRPRPRSRRHHRQAQAGAENGISRRRCLRLSVIQPPTNCGRGMRAMRTALPSRVADRSGTCTSLPIDRGDQAQRGRDSGALQTRRQAGRFAGRRRRRRSLHVSGSLRRSLA